MMRFLISNTQSGAELGTYDAADEAAALDLMAQDAGYADYAEAQRVAPAAEGEISVVLHRVQGATGTPPGSPDYRERLEHWEQGANEMILLGVVEYRSRAVLGGERHNGVYVEIVPGSVQAPQLLREGATPDSGYGRKILRQLEEAADRLRETEANGGLLWKLRNKDGYLAYAHGLTVRAHGQRPFWTRQEVLGEADAARG